VDRERKRRHPICALLESAPGLKNHSDISEFSFWLNKRSKGESVGIGFEKVEVFADS
jgi:hypothetical protein